MKNSIRLFAAILSFVLIAGLFNPLGATEVQAKTKTTFGVPFISVSEAKNGKAVKISIFSTCFDDVNDNSGFVIYMKSENEKKYKKRKKLINRILDG